MEITTFLIALDMQSTQECLSAVLVGAELSEQDVRKFVNVV